MMAVNGSGKLPMKTRFVIIQRTSCAFSPKDKQEVKSLSLDKAIQKVVRPYRNGQLCFGRMTRQRFIG